MRPAFVLGLGGTGLSAVQSLGRKGIPVVGFTYRPNDPGRWSRYCKRVVACPDPVASPQMFIECLLNARREWAEDPVLIPAEDTYVNVVGTYREDLGRSFRMNIPSSDVMQCIADKRLQYEAAIKAGISIPQTFAPQNMHEVREIQESLQYPAFIKGAFAHLFTRAFGRRGFKGFRVGDPSELIACYEQVFAVGVDAVVQTVIEGPASSLTSACLYCSSGNGKIAAQFAMRKLRQAPIGFGVGTLVESVRDPEVMELGAALCRHIGYTGVAEIEFKRDSTGTPRLIELNPRLWEQAALATAAGVDFPYLLYLDLDQGRVPLIQSYSVNIRWADIVEDFSVCYRNRREIGYSLSGLLRSWLRLRAINAFSWKDPGPLLAKLWTFTRGVIKAGARKVVSGQTQMKPAPHGERVMADATKTRAQGPNGPASTAR